MQYTKRIAAVEDIGAVLGILSICGEHMHRQGMDHWYPYRSREDFECLTVDAQIYILYADDFLIGTFYVTETSRSYYTRDMWREPDARAYYLGGVGILPMLQGQGAGRWLMQQANAVTVEDGCSAIRFDAAGFNAPLLRFYDSLGYERRHEFTTESGKWMVCYEQTFSG